MFLNIGKITSVSIQYNDIGDQTIKNISEKFFGGKGARNLKKLVLKNPVNQKLRNLDKFFEEMSWNSHYLKNLQKLTVSQFYLDNSCLALIVDAVKNLSNMYYLDISGNRFSDLSPFITQIQSHNHLRHLHLGFNSCQPLKFTHTIAHYIHTSNTLLHINLSGLDLKNVNYIYKKGIRKARTLLSCHLGGIGK